MKLLATLPLVAVLFGCEATNHDHAYNDDFGNDPRVSDDVFVYVPESQRDDVDRGCRAGEWTTQRRRAER